MLLLTGVTGAAGSFIANEFALHRVPVRFLVRDKTKAKHFEKNSTIEVVEGDMARQGTLAAALKGVERVLMISSSTPDMVETLPFAGLQRGRSLARCICDFPCQFKTAQRKFNELTYRPSRFQRGAQSSRLPNTPDLLASAPGLSL
jgi:NAD(P)H-binding